MIRAEINWDTYFKKFEGLRREDLFSAISRALLQTKSMFNENVLSSDMDLSSRESFIKTATIQLMSTPEYQMC